MTALSNRDNELPDGEKIKISDDEIYRTVIDSYLQSDNLSWSRVQTIQAIEAGILAAAFYWNSWHSALVMIGGVLLVAAMWLLVERDWQIRDQHFDFIDEAHSKFSKIRMRKDASSIFICGKYIVRFVLSCIIVINLILMGIYIGTACMFGSNLGGPLGTPWIR